MRDAVGITYYQTLNFIQNQYKLTMPFLDCLLKCLFAFFRFPDCFVFYHTGSLLYHLYHDHFRFHKGSDGCKTCKFTQTIGRVAPPPNRLLGAGIFYSFLLFNSCNITSIFKVALVTSIIFQILCSIPPQ